MPTVPRRRMVKKTESLLLAELGASFPRDTRWEDIAAAWVDCFDAAE
jgi:hypothetical protein